MGNRLADSWYRKDPATYERLRQQVEEAYPSFRFEERDSGLYVVGEFILEDQGEILDRYRIAVKVAEDSPRGLPYLFDVQGRIPWVLDRHMEPNGRACIFLPDAYWLEHPDGMSLVEFLDGPARSFLANQSLIDTGATDAWPQGQWAHGLRGIYQFYSDILGTQDLNVLINCLSAVRDPRFKGHWPCPCGNGQISRKCHGPQLWRLRSSIPAEVLDVSLGRLRDLAQAVKDQRTKQ